MAKEARTVWEYPFPVVGEADPYNPDRQWPEEEDVWAGQDPLFKVLGFSALRGSEEIAAMEASQTNPFALTSELARRSIAMVDGRPVNKADFEQDTLWTKMPPKVRELCIVAYNDIHVVGADLRNSFRKNRRITTV